MIPESLNRRAKELGLSASGSRPASCAARRALYDQLLRGQEAFVVVARRGPAAVGYALAQVHLGPDDTWTTGDRIGEVESLALLSRERGHGVGTLLLDCAEAILDNHGARDVIIGVLAGNDSARRFYERRGMTPAVIKMMRIGPKPAGQA